MHGYMAFDKRRCIVLTMQYASLGGRMAKIFTVILHFIALELSQHIRSKRGKNRKHVLQFTGYIHWHWVLREAIYLKTRDYNQIRLIMDTLVVRDIRGNCDPSSFGGEARGMPRSKTVLITAAIFSAGPAGRERCSSAWSQATNSACNHT